MAIRIISPRNSFIQFSESDQITGCSVEGFSLCLPVFQDSDVAFQFIVEADTEAEADALCDLGNNLIAIGIVERCGDDNLLTFEGKTSRRRISPTQVLYMWSGLPDFATVIPIGGCFHITVNVDGNVYCSNCLQRIGDTCFTSVVDYSGDGNQFGFDYCDGGLVEGDQELCEPTIIEFVNEATLAIPYTASLQAKYGDVPTVSVWIRDTDGTLVEMGLRISFDDFPPSLISIDNGGPASGIVKIS